MHQAVQDLDWKYHGLSLQEKHLETKRLDQCCKGTQICLPKMLHADAISAPKVPSSTAYIHTCLHLI